MWTLFIFLLLQAGPPPCQLPEIITKPPSLVVQVVDHEWLPIPGAHVAITPLNGKSQPITISADITGRVTFFATEETDYTIMVKLSGFKEGRLKRLHLYKAFGANHTRFVQLVLKPSGFSTNVD